MLWHSQSKRLDWIYCVDMHVCIIESTVITKEKEICLPTRNISVVIDVKEQICLHNVRYL